MAEGAPSPPNDGKASLAPAAPLFLVVFLFLLFGFWESLAQELFYQSGFLTRFYGEETVAAARDKGSTPEQRKIRTRLGLWSKSFGFPLGLASLFLLFRLIPELSPREMGLTWRDAGANVRAGLSAAVVATPILFCLNALVVWCFQRLGEGAGEEHPFTKLAEQGLTPPEWGLLVFAAVVVAPITEEIIFRGVLQPCLTRHSWGGWVGMAAAVGMALLQRGPRALEHWGDGPGAILLNLAPVLFVLVLVPHFVVLWRGERGTEAGGIFATAVLFGAFHSFAWPSPVALTVLGLVLGSLAHRWKSLVGPIVLHGAFNAINVVLLLITLLARKYETVSLWLP